MPRGQYQRFKKAAPGAVVTNAEVARAGIHVPADAIPDEAFEQSVEIGPQLPRGWAKGAHLNVRNVGTEYRITLFPEEFDPLQPERCLRFTSPVECQNFVSRWYSRESHDPRAR